MRYPNPCDEPTHSPITAPIGAYTVASLMPESRFGTAAGSFMRNKSLKGQIDNLNNQISEMQNKLTPVVQSLQENKDQNAPQ